MRIYVAVTSIHPLRIYIYNEGLARFATHEYENTRENMQNVFSHLTNYSLNKFSEAFVKNETADDLCYGSKWCLSNLKDYLKTFNINSDQLWDKIEDMVRCFFLSLYANIPYFLANFKQIHLSFRDALSNF